MPSINGSSRESALALARSLVAYMMRPGGQSQFSPILDQQANDSTGRFESLHNWIIFVIG